MESISSVLNCIFSIILFCITFLITPIHAGGDISFNIKQSILPVRMIYLDNNNEIIKVWNNVTFKDRKYIIKFFINNIEVTTNAELMRKYTEILLRTDLFKQGFVLLNSNKNQKPNVQLIESLKGYQEIYTYI